MDIWLLRTIWAFFTIGRHGHIQIVTFALVMICRFLSIPVLHFEILGSLALPATGTDQHCWNACLDCSEQSPFPLLSLRNQKIKRPEGRHPLINCFNVK